MPTFLKIGHSSADMMLSTILDLFGECLDHPRTVLGGLYYCANFGCDRCSTFDSIKVSIFGTFGSKMLIHVPIIGSFGWFDPRSW